MGKQINQNTSKKIDELLLTISKDQNYKNNKKIIKEIIEFAKRNSFPLREKRKLFCKKCLSYFFVGNNCQIRINNKIKSIRCLNCGNTSRLKLKNTKI